ncbi:ATP-binding protein [Oceanobacillus kapialis]|uniref:ATP-binding protein n=1 Tax=Oceanobacillus kapialis TaxID=481353 RepID=A0ABW5PZL1_9BACI
MKGISSVGNIVQPKQQHLETYICKGCGKEVNRTEMVIPIGPRKGETIVADLGCKCESIRLAKQALEQRNRSKLDRIQKEFNGNSLMNKSLQRANFSNYKPTTPDLHAAKSKLMEYANNFDRNESGNILLVGNYGTGKSHLSVAVTKELLKKNFTCLFLSVPKLLTQIKDTYNASNNLSESEILSLIEQVDLFVLDDLGTEYTNQKNGNDNWTHTKLFEVLDNRSGKPTIFTTNLSGDQLETKLNERNLSRVLDGTEIIKMNGPDYRRKDF